jgi:hypothetical protein
MRLTFSRHHFPYLDKGQEEGGDCGDLRRAHPQKSGEKRDQSAAPRRGFVSEPADHAFFKGRVGALGRERLVE